MNGWASTVWSRSAPLLLVSPWFPSMSVMRGLLGAATPGFVSWIHYLWPKNPSLWSGHKAGRGSHPSGRCLFNATKDFKLLCMYRFPFSLSSRQLLLKKKNVKLISLKSPLRSRIHKASFNESLAKTNLQGRESAEQWEEEVSGDHTHMDQLSHQQQIKKHIFTSTACTWKTGKHNKDA